MHICHVSPHLPPDQAANALLPAQLGRWMSARGDQISYVAHEPAQQRAASHDDLTPRGVRWIPRRQRSALRRALKLDAWQLMRRVDSALNETAASADLLHLHSNGIIIEAAARWARRRRVPYVLTLYGTEIWHYKRRRPLDLFTDAYRHAEHVTFYSRRLLDHAKASGLDRSGLSVIYPAVAESFRPLDDAARASWRRRTGVTEPLLVVNVKRLHPLAGQSFLLEAFARINAARRDARLVICGDGPLRSELQRLAEDLQISDRVTFTGLIPNDCVAGYAAAADVFVLPSLLEALPTVAVEALASGTPVISADHPGGLELHELFGDDVSIVPRENVDALARALGDFLRRPSRVTPQTAQTIASLFSPAAVTAAFDQVYQRAAKGHA